MRQPVRAAAPRESHREDGDQIERERGGGDRRHGGRYQVGGAGLAVLGSRS
jgi:hypothetical protein